MHTPGTNVFLFWVVGHFQKCFFLPNEPYVSDMCTYCCLTLVYYRPTSYISAVIYWVISHRHYFPNFSYFSRFSQKFPNFWTYNRKFSNFITCAWCVQIPKIFIYDINNTLYVMGKQNYLIIIEISCFRRIKRRDPVFQNFRIFLK